MHWNGTSIDTDIHQDTQQRKQNTMALFKPSDYSKAQMISVQFEHSIFRVHGHLLAKLISPSQRGLDRTVQLRAISDAAGHTIVHYLYTGTYQSPAFINDNLTPDDKEDAMLRLGLELYVVTRKYGLGTLQQCVQAEIEAASRTLPAVKTLQTVKEVIPRPDRDDLWLQEFSRSLLRSTYSDIGSLLKSELMAMENSETTISMTEMFLRLMIDTSEDETAESPQQIVEEAEGLEPVPHPDVQDLLDERKELLRKLERKGKLLRRDRARLSEIEATREVEQALAPRDVDEGEDSGVMVEH